jgi:hypothetical protein
MIDKHNNQKIEIGKYVVGWAKSGAHGILNRTILNAEETLNNLKNHLEKNLLKEK